MPLQVEIQCLSGSSYDKTIQFRAGAENEAAELLDEILIGGVNVSELARVGLVENVNQVSPGTLPINSPCGRGFPSTPRAPTSPPVELVALGHGFTNSAK